MFSVLRALLPEINLDEWMVCGWIRSRQMVVICHVGISKYEKRSMVCTTRLG